MGTQECHLGTLPSPPFSKSKFSKPSSGFRIWGACSLEGTIQCAEGQSSSKESQLSLMGLFSPVLQTQF
jgi:hypothetical protein